MSLIGSDIARLFLGGSQQGAGMVGQAINNGQQDRALDMQGARDAESQRQFGVRSDQADRLFDQRVFEFDTGTQQYDQSQADLAEQRRLQDADRNADNLRLQRNSDFNQRLAGATRGVTPPPMAAPVDPNFAGPQPRQQYEAWSDDDLLEGIAQQARFADEPTNLTPDMMQAYLPKMAALAQADGGVISPNTPDRLAHPIERAMARSLIGKDPKSFGAATMDAGQDWGKTLGGYVEGITPEETTWAVGEAKRRGVDPAALVPILQQQRQQREQQRNQDRLRQDQKLLNIDKSIDDYDRQIKDENKWLEANEPPAKPPANKPDPKWAAANAEYQARKAMNTERMKMMLAHQKKRDALMGEQVMEPDLVKQDVGAMLNAPAEPQKPAGGGQQDMIAWSADFLKKMGRKPTRQEFQQQQQVMGQPSPAGVK